MLTVPHSGGQPRLLGNTWHEETAIYTFIKKSQSDFQVHQLLYEKILGHVFSRIGVSKYVPDYRYTSRSGRGEVGTKVGSLCMTEG